MFPEFQTFKKIPRLSRDITISEKLDGSNGVIYIDEKNNILAGSRNRWLWSSLENNEIEKDNFGFGGWVRDNQLELLKLGKGYHYGEIIGSGIQRNYGLKERRFYLFNTSKWCMWDEEPKLISIDPKTKVEKYQQKAPECCYIVPILYSGIFSENAILDSLALLDSLGSSAVPGFKPAEGIVIYFPSCRYYFKKTIKNDEIPKGVINE